ncbi:MAG TPA: tetratricopeptide repeat protein [Chthoniobacterales bacterium]
MEGPTASDYDEKLREMGNYLWELDQEGDIAHQEGDEFRLGEIEKKIERIAARAAHFRDVDGPHRLLAGLVNGLALRMLQRWEDAAQAFLDVLDENPENGEAWLELTWCLSEMGKWQDAELAARKGTEFFPEVSGAWGNLAQVLLRLGKRDEAREVLEKAIHLDPKDRRNQDLMRQVREEGKREC